MKTDTYTKVLLTIIAFCLTFNVLKDIRIIPDVYADSSKMTIPANSMPVANLLKANEDGSLNVRLTASSVMEVKPASGARFTVEPSSSSEFRVKPASGSKFKIEPDSYAKFKIENTDNNPLYVSPGRYAVFNVKQTGSSTYNEKITAPVSTYAYPSPASDKITITYQVFSPNEYMTICSMDGKVMDYILLDSSGNEIEINLAGYTAGIYVYSFSGNGGKFIVKK